MYKSFIHSFHTDLLVQSYFVILTDTWKEIESGQYMEVCVNVGQRDLQKHFHQPVLLPAKEKHIKRTFSYMYRIES